MRARSCSFALLLTAALCLGAASEAQLSFHVALDTATQTWTVECELDNPGGKDFDFWLARWTAGAYHRADYGRFASGFEAFDASGEPLDVVRQGETHISIAATGHRHVRITYQARSMSKGLFADGVIDVEANRIAEGYAYLNPVSLLGFVPERRDEAYEVSFELPTDWRVASVLKKNAAGVYRAPSYYRMEDSPFLFSPSMESVKLEAGGKPLTVTVHGLEEDDFYTLVEDCSTIVEATSKLLGGLPYDQYEFLFAYVPDGGGSGLEHTFSTLILMPENLPTEIGHGITSHEFFHLFCAERIHVQALQKPDYTKTFQTQTIWVNESITEYLSNMVLVHAGMTSREDFLAGYAQANPQIDAMQQAGMLRPVTEASKLATEWDDFNALISFSVSLYQNGARTMFALDMEMRRLNGGQRGLVDLVRYLMAEYVEKGRGFPEDGMLDILNKVSGGDLSAFYKAHIAGLEPLDMGAALAVIGYGLEGGVLVELEHPSAEQMAAREDYFSPGLE